MDVAERRLLAKARGSRAHSCEIAVLLHSLETMLVQVQAMAYPSPQPILDII